MRGRIEWRGRCEVVKPVFANCAAVPGLHFEFHVRWGGLSGLLLGN